MLGLSHRWRRQFHYGMQQRRVKAFFSPHYINTVCQLESSLWMAVKWKRRLSEYKLLWIISALFCIAPRVSAGFRATRLKPLTIHQGRSNNTNEYGLHYRDKSIYTNTNTEKPINKAQCAKAIQHLSSPVLSRCEGVLTSADLSAFPPLLLQIAKHTYLLIKMKEILIPPRALRGHISILFNYALV